LFTTAVKMQSFAVMFFWCTMSFSPEQSTSFNSIWNCCHFHLQRSSDEEICDDVSLVLERVETGPVVANVSRVSDQSSKDQLKLIT
jgi:hypothetical protein